MNVEPGTRYQCTAPISPEYPEQASVNAHQRAYTSGRANRSAPSGTGQVIKLHAARANKTTDTSHVVRPSGRHGRAPARTTAIDLITIWKSWKVPAELSL